MSFYFYQEQEFNEQELVEIELPMYARMYSFVYDEKLPNIAFWIHNHVKIEIMLVLKGTADVKINSTEYEIKSGDIVIFNPFELHQGKFGKLETELEYITFQADIEKIFNYQGTHINRNIEEIIEGKYKFQNVIRKNEEFAEEIARICKDSYCESQKNGNVSECKMFALSYSLFGILFENFYLKNTEKVYRHDIAFMLKMSKYLKKNYSQDISTADVASEMFMSTSQFCHVFKQHFGMNFSNYLCKYRVTIASQKYKNSNTPIYNIATEVGFQNYCYFSRSFKKYIGMTPAKYFDKWK